MKKRAWWIALGILLGLPLAAPFLKADRFAPAITTSLERALQRKVEVGEVHMHLLTGPGFTLSDVVIHEDPTVSAEPLAYVTSLVVRLRLWPLLRGSLEVSSLRLEEPSVNLMQTVDGVWNVQALLRSSSQATGVVLPDLEVRSGRLNFKIAGTKSAYYFTNTDLDFSAESGERAFDLWFRGEPARTDRTAQGFGRFSGRGRWLRPEGTEPRLEMDYQLEPSAIEELAKLLASRDLGLHGMVESRGRLAGPLSAIELSGRLDLNDLHYWSQPPRPSQWRLGYKGTWNLTGQKLRVATEAPKDGALPFRAEVELSAYLSTPQWRVELQPEQMPLALAVGWLRPEGDRFKNLRVEGALSGSVRMSQDRAAEGKLTVDSFALVDNGEAVLKSPVIPVELADGKLKMQAPVMEFGTKGVASMEYEWNWRTREAEARLNPKPLSIEQVQMLVAMAGEKPPLLSELRGGRIRGRLLVHRLEDAPPDWTGLFTLSETRVSIPELAEALELQQATVELNGHRLAAKGVKARVGKIGWEGDYRYDPIQARPHHFDVRLGRADAGELERLLAPALQRERGFVARTLQIGEDRVPEWLASRRAEGSVRIESLEMGEQTLANVRTTLRWDASKVGLRDLRFSWNGGEISGELGINLERAEPAYTWQGKATGLNWQGGKVDASWSAEARGLGVDIGRTGTAKGDISGEQVQFGESASRRFGGKFGIRVEGSGPKIDLENIEIEIGGLTWTGKGSTQKDGRLVVDLAGDGREMKLSGPVMPLELR